MFEKFYPQIEEHTVDGIVRKVVACVEKECPHPVQRQHCSQQNEEQPQIGTAESLVDDDLQHQRHQKSEAGAEDVEDNAYAKHLAVREDDLVQLFKTAQIFAAHKGNSVMKLSIEKKKSLFLLSLKVCTSVECNLKISICKPGNEKKWKKNLIFQPLC